MTEWYLPSDYKPSKDSSLRYIVSETQLRKFWCMKFAPLDFNKDHIKEFIVREKLEVKPL